MGSTAMGSDAVTSIEAALRELVRSQEAAYGFGDRRPDSLWDHLLRTARIAERLGRAEGLAPATCRIAGLFHDAGKFHDGRLHGDDQPEELHSVAVLRRLLGTQLPQPQVEEVAEAILQLYRDDPQPSLLACVLFDADNLDKLGPLGVANFFVKRGLRGRGVSSSLICRLTVELTYARHAPACMHTATGRTWAQRRARESEQILMALLEQLREDGIAETTVDEVGLDGLLLVVAAPVACSCGGALSRELWQEPGLKCTEIHLAHTCRSCGDRHQVRFCRPRLVAV
jgi:uncharacterized protein